MARALAVAWPSSANWAENRAMFSALPALRWRCPARARAWFSREYSAEIDSTTRVCRLASSICRLAINSPSMSRSAAMACICASCSAISRALPAACAASSSCCRRWLNGCRALSLARKRPVAAPTCSPACCRVASMASMAAVSM